MVLSSATLHRTTYPGDMLRGSVKVGGVDDPIWQQAPLVVVRPQVHQARRQFRIPLGIGAVGLVVAGLLVYWATQSGHHSGGDPGGRILNQLRTVLLALPPNVTVELHDDSEPSWLNCTGQPGQIEGWSDPTAYVAFTWGGSSSSLIAHVNDQLTEAGWGSFTQSAAGHIIAADWSKRLKNGTTARAILSLEFNQWGLSASAPPIGIRNSC